LDFYNDFSTLINYSQENNMTTCATRVALSLYCHLVELSSFHFMIINLLGCKAGDEYVVNPFKSIDSFSKTKGTLRPASAKSKFQLIKKKAEKCNDNSIKEYIDLVFDDEIRNSFSHSDYVITEEFFKYSKKISINSLQNKISYCLDFYMAFIESYRLFKKMFIHEKTFHKCPGYEVLELLCNEEEGIYGFNMHFHNGNKASYIRTKDSTNPLNICINSDGTINFQIGFVDELEHIWKVNGIPFHE